MAEDNNTPQAGAAASGDKPQLKFSLQRIYVKDISFEAPNSPSVFKQAFKPKVNLDLNTSSTKIADDQYEVVIKVTAQVNDNETGTTSFWLKSSRRACSAFPALKVRSWNRRWVRSAPTCYSLTPASAWITWSTVVASRR